MPDLFDQLKQKYQPVLDTIQREGAEVQGLSLDGNQLYLKAMAVSEASKNRIWDSIKVVDPTIRISSMTLNSARAIRPTRRSQAITSPKSANAITETRINIQ